MNLLLNKWNNKFWNVKIYYNKKGNYRKPNNNKMKNCKSIYKIFKKLYRINKKK
jgi:hypothetical protein